MDIKLLTWEFIIPFFISIISVILMRNKFIVLQFKNKEKDNFVYILICWVLILSLISVSQMFFTKYFYRRIDVNNVSEIKFDRAISEYKINKLYVDQRKGKGDFQTKIVGRNGEKIQMQVFFIAPLFKDSASIKAISKVWYSEIKDTTISYSLSDNKKIAASKKFIQNTIDYFEKKNFSKEHHFEKVFQSDEKETFDKLILNHDKPALILKPVLNKIKNADYFLYLYFKILVGGLLIILFSLVFIPYKEVGYDKKNDEFLSILNFLIPKKGNYFLPVIINLNIIYYLVLAFLQVDIFYPKTEDLIVFGAVSSEKMAQGEIWRLLTAIFMHGSLPHIVYNMFILSFAGVFAKDIFGEKRLSIIYFTSGILSIIITLCFHHDKYVGLGASGAIFGVIGGIFGISCANGFKENKTVIFVTSGYLLLNVLFGLITNSDNVVHISGFLIGALVSWLFFIRK
jgi:rhomboid protease GluP